VHFGKTFVCYEELPTGRVAAHFADGTVAEGDVLIAADGGGSRVRRQFLPHAERLDTGIVGIAGKVFLDGGNRERIAPELRNGMTLASGQGGYSLFVALQDIDGIAASGLGVNDEAAVADAHFENTRSYLMWAFGARREKLGLAGGDTDQMSGDQLRAIVIRTMASRAWDQRFRDLVELADAPTINALTIRTALPLAP
jgi:salicylate hydroxylase